MPPITPVPTSFSSWVQVVPLRVYTHAAPMTPLSTGPPTMAVLPSEDSETEVPWLAAPIAPMPTSLSCWVQVVPLRVHTHAAPMPLLSLGPPMMAVLPSEDS